MERQTFCTNCQLLQYTWYYTT